MTTKKFVQLVSLVTYANVRIQEKELEFDIERSTAEYCYGLEFIQQPPEVIAGSAVLIASGAYNWFEYLKYNKAKRVKLHYRPSLQFNLPDHITTAFVGGGSHWLVEVLYENKSHLYLSEGMASTSQTPRPLKTQFVLLKDELESFEDVSTTVIEARARLRQVLENLISFASRFEHTQHLAENFTRDLNTLTEFEPAETDDFIPYSIYSKEAHQLLETAFRSWVFGGMGSWNDLAFAGEYQAEYTSLSEELYEVICNAIVSGVNSYP